MKKILTVIIFCLMFCACGSSNQDSPRINIIKPTQNQVFKKGEAFTLKIALENFSFNIPNGMDPNIGTQKGNLSLAHNKNLSFKHESDEMLKTNPDARNGHMHIYINDGEDSDPHITAWSEEVNVLLPEDLTNGSYSLRLELRDDHHVKLGSEYDEYLNFTIE